MTMRTLPVVVACLVLGHATAMAEVKDTLYRFTGIFAGGMTYCSSQFDDVPTGLNRVGFFGVARLLWHPEHYLAVGGEVGLTNVYSIERTDVNMAGDPVHIRSVLNGFPLMINVTMTPVRNLNLILGFGAMIMRSNVEQEGSPTVSVGSTSTVGMLGVNYMFPVGERSYIGAEVNYMIIDRYDDKLFRFGLVYAYDIARY
jgi:hypothetical protein